MVTTRLSVRLAAVVLLALPIPVMGQGSSGVVTTTPTVSGGKGPVTESQLIERYLAMAGSEANAKSLVNGLRHGTEITLTGTVSSPSPPPLRPGSPLKPPSSSTTTVTVKFTPPTGNMGWGNVDIALAFTEAQATENGIKNPPTPPQLQAILIGGQVINTVLKTNVKVPGILTLRASGMGWPQIAEQLGFKLQ